jgi:hydroxypyruvate reductase
MGSLQDVARRLTAVALAAVDPERLVRDELARRGGPGALRGADRFDAVLAVGKAAAALARGVRGQLAPSFSPRRLLVRPHSSPALLDPGWEQRSGGHPFPDRQSVAAGERLRDWLASLDPSHRLLALISGGASACVELPAPGLTLEDLIATQRLLLASGLPIHRVNAVRKHLSSLKGGGALRLARGRVLALVLSDVPGDDLGTIASGLFTADSTTFDDALEAVRDLPVPEAVRRHLLAGGRGEVPETVKPDDPALARLEALRIGGVGTAVAAVLAETRRLGFPGAAGELSGGAAAAGRELVRRGRALGMAAGVALVLGGETTVRLGPAGSTGQGGRNQELALAAAGELAVPAPDVAGQELVLTLATDGEDGPTRAAGGVVDGATWEAIRRTGSDPADLLARHDSGTALRLVPGALLETGVTGTNVGDLAIYLRRPAA